MLEGGILTFVATRNVFRFCRGPYSRVSERFQRCDLSLALAFAAVTAGSTEGSVGTRWTWSRTGRPTPSCRRQRKHKRTPVIQLALRPNRPSMRTHNVLRNRQSEPSPAGFSGPRLIHAIEPFKQSRQMLRRNPAAKVLYIKLDPWLRRPSSEFHPPAAPSILHGIVDKVREHLMNRLPIREHQWKRFH